MEVGINPKDRFLQEYMQVSKPFLPLVGVQRNSGCRTGQPPLTMLLLPHLFQEARVRFRPKLSGAATRGTRTVKLVWHQRAEL